MAVDASFKCTNCQTENELKSLQLPPVQFPVSTKPYAQKLFKFKDRFAIGCFGASFVNQKSMLHQIKSLEANVETVTNVDTVAEKIMYHFHKEFEKEVKDLSKLPSDVFPFGFQVVGFDSDGVGKTWIVSIGRQPNKHAETKLGTTYSGDIALIRKLMEATGGIPSLQPNLQTFSLQDAVEYAQFLIRFVADYQRFSNMIPTVGGEIDVALVTDYAGLKWIKRKEIDKLLDESPLH
ncbi:MAG: hypothetical protein HYS38_00140 [Acidobacteria bacterium]|nr:hypothetical protein [Acidobacteriota bacterium]